MSKPVEIVEIKSESDPVLDPHFSVRIVQPMLVGNKWREKGEVVRAPERTAREMCLSGTAVPHGFMAAAWLERPNIAAGAPPVGEAIPYPPNIKIVNDGTLFQDGRSFSKTDGAFHYRGDIYRILALQDPEPGSKTAEVAARGARKLPKIELVRPLSAEERKLLARLRRDVDQKARLGS